MSLISHDYMGPAHRTEYHVKCYLLPLKHTEVEWVSSPLQGSHQGLSFLKSWRKTVTDSAVLFFFISLPWTVCCGWHHWAILQIIHFPFLQLMRSTACYKKKKNSIQLHGCMQGPHSSHTHYWGVCSFFDTHVYRQGWIPVRMDHVKSTMSTKIIICAFSSKSFLPKSINLDALIYNKSVTS